MKKTATFLLMFLTVSVLYGQDIRGTWTGTLDIPEGQLRVHFNISGAENAYTSTLDSPDQNAFGISVDTTYFKKPELTIKVANLDLVYVGTVLDDNTMNGTLTQMGQTLEMNMKKKKE
jgi:uncharacterized protein